MKKWIVLTTFVLISFKAFSNSFTTYNIRNFDYNSSLANSTDLRELDNIFRRVNTDFLAVQEIKNKYFFKKFIELNYQDYQVSISSCGGSGNQKLGFVFRKSKFKLVKFVEDLSFSNSKKSKKGCSSLRPAYIGYFQVKNSHKKFVAISVHLKAGDGDRNFQRRNEQYVKLAALVKRLKREGHSNIVVMGDFNTTGFISQNTDYNNFRTMLAQSTMENKTNSASCSAYWSGHDNDDSNQSSKLDHVVMSKNFLGKRVESVKLYAHCERFKCASQNEDHMGVSYDGVSDHCPLQVNLK